MQLFIWKRLDKVTNYYHCDGGLVVIACDDMRANLRMRTKISKCPILSRCRTPAMLTHRTRRCLYSQTQGAVDDQLSHTQFMRNSVRHFIYVCREGSF